MSNQKGLPPHQRNDLNLTRKVKVYFWCGGQSLMEILIGLGVISIMISASSYALVSVLRNSTVNEQNQSAGLIGNSLLESAAVSAEANWNGIYNLSKGSANHYFLINSPTTTPLAVVGDESVLSENIINGLVGHWKFDEISTNTTWAYDSSGTGNLGALTNSPTRTASASCKVGACLSFDGTSQYINIPGTNTQFGSSDFTISVWVNPVSLSAVGDVISDANGNVILRMGGAYGSRAILFLNDWSNYRYSGDFNAGAWNYLVYVKQGQTLHAYINNVLADSSSAGTIPVTVGSMGSLNIGLYGAYFNGKMDDFRIYNRALSTTEISQLYDSPAYSRYFYADNVKRTLCGTGVITTDAESTCLGASGVSEDPSTQKITANTSWNLKGVSGSLDNSIYMTRWVNSVSKQTDWGGSSGTAGAVSEFGTNYFDYSGIATTTSGAIKVSGI